MNFHQVIRDKHDFLKPDLAISDIAISIDDVVIDFGCGSGFWTIPIAKIVGPKGLVLAIDPRESKLTFVRSKADKLGLSNIRYIKAPLSSITMPVTEIADCIIISNILSKIDNDLSLVFSCRKNSKPGTKLVIIDWNEKSKLGPKSNKRVDVEIVMKEAERSGFEFKKLLNAGSDHFGLYFEYKGGKSGE